MNVRAPLKQRQSFQPASGGVQESSDDTDAVEAKIECFRLGGAKSKLFHILS